MEFFLACIFPHSDWIRRDTEYFSVFSTNAGKYGPEKTLCLDTFHAVEWTYDIAQKMKFSIKDLFSKCDQICSFLWIWSHLLKKSLIENVIFCPLWQVLHTIKRAMILPRIYIDTANLQVNFHSSVTFYDWYFLTLSLFYGTFNKGDLYKILVKWNSKFEDLEFWEKYPVSNRSKNRSKTKNRLNNFKISI